MKQLFALFFSLFCSIGATAQFVLLNEYAQIENTEEGWFELYNPTEEVYFLENWKLRLNAGESAIALPPIAIDAGAYEVISISDAALRFSTSITAHISQQTTRIELLNAHDEVISSLYWVCIPAAMSFGRSGSFPSQVHFLEPSPGGLNASEVHVFQEKPIQLSHASGFYDEVSLEIMNSTDPSAAVHFTLTEAAPALTSAAWPVEGLTLNAANSTTTELSFIPASNEHLEPSETHETAHTVALQAFEFGCPVSPVDRRVYFIDNVSFRDLDVPIISISTDDECLFGEDGIYGYGLSGENFIFKGRFWERDATMAYFDESKTLKLEQNIGIRIRGNGSRYAPQKSFKLFARNEYDTADDFENVFFPSENIEEFERLNLRTPHTDYLTSLMTDQFAMQLVRNLNLDAPNAKTCLLFLNGEFWGVYSLQESMDEHYPESHYDIDDDDVIMFDDEVPAYYQDILNYAQSNDLTLSSHYDWIEARVDLPSLIDYYAAQLFFANWDWPVKNVKVWYSAVASAPLRYYFFDCDACLQEFQQESIDQFYPEQSTDGYKVLFSKLMQNDGFRTQFTTRTLALLSTEFAVDNLLEQLEESRSKMATLVDYQIARWGFPHSRGAWEDNVESIRFFLMTRHFEFIQQLEEIHNNQLRVFPNPSAPNSVIQIESFGQFTSAFNFEIHDLMGKSVHWGASEDERIELINLPPGIYILRLGQNGFLATTRFTIGY
ncbi:MAG: hypothetical protein ACI923_000576 [Flavobacteriales bacterium]|jgi:hypothetical protein